MTAKTGRKTQMIAEEAARLILETGEPDYAYARKRAAQRLGLDRPGLLPHLRDVDAAVQARRALFGEVVDAKWLQQRQSAALELMGLFDVFSPRLVGALLDRVAVGGGVEIHLFSDDAKGVAIELLNLGVRYIANERDFSTQTVPGFTFEWQGVPVSLQVFGHDGLRSAPLDIISGRPMRRANRREVEQIFAAQSPESPA